MFCEWHKFCFAYSLKKAKYAGRARLDRHVKGWILKPFGAVFLSVLLLYSGAAWALQSCLQGDVDVDSATASSVSTEGIDQGATPNSALAHRPAARLHCPDSHDPTGVIIGPSTTLRLKPFGGGILLKFSLAAGLASASEAQIVWLFALYWLPPFSLPVSSSRHLFLSVLRI